MKKLQILIFVLFTLLVSISLHLRSVKLNALETMPKFLGIELVVDSNGLTKGDMYIDIENPNNSMLIDKYTVSLPFMGIDQVKAYLFNEIVKSNLLLQDSGHYNLEMDFDDKKMINIGRYLSIRIEFTTNKLFRESGSIREIYIPEIFKNASYTTKVLKIKIDKGFGKLLYHDPKILSKNEDLRFYYLETDKKKPILLVFGEDRIFDIKSAFTIQKTDQKTNKYIINLFGTYEKVVYRSLNIGDYGVINQFGNNYLIVHSNNGSNMIGEVEATLRLDEQKIFLSEVPKYDFFIDVDEPIYQEIKEIFSRNEVTFFEKFLDLNNLIKSKSGSSRSLKVNWETGREIWKKLTNPQSPLNSFEVCYIQISIAEMFGYKANMFYGYLLYPNYLEIDISNPHVWCSFSDGKEILVMDTFLENLTGVDYFNNFRFDRFTVGLAHPKFFYDPMLGLRNVLSENIKLQINPSKRDMSNFLNLDETTPSLIGQIITEDKTQSGKYFTGELYVDNPTDRFITFNDIRVNGKSEIANLYIHKDLKYSLIPKRLNKLKFHYLRELNPFFEGSKILDISIYDRSEKIVEASKSIYFERNPKSFYIIIILSINFFLVLTATVIYKKQKKNLLEYTSKFEKK